MVHGQTASVRVGGALTYEFLLPRFQDLVETERQKNYLVTIVVLFLASTQSDFHERVLRCVPLFSVSLFGSKPVCHLFV
jgi:hypothetical protein